MKNPFSPSFGSVPDNFIDRQLLAQETIRKIQEGDKLYQTSLIYGQRGSGKTALMTEIAKALSQHADWLVVNLILESDLILSILSQLQNQINQKKLTAKLDLKVSFLGLELGTSLSAEKHSLDYQAILFNLLRDLKKQGVQVLITIDEIKATPELRKFISYYQLMIREDLAVALMMAGLPKNVSELQNDDVLTFLLRANRIVLNPLDLMIIKDSYQMLFKQGSYKLELKPALYMAKQTAGFAYAFQLLGYLLWDHLETSTETTLTIATVDAVLEEFHQILYRNVYLRIYGSLTVKEKEYLQAMAQIGGDKIKNAQIGAVLQKPANYLSVYRRKLIDSQIIVATDYGYVSFLLPAFGNYLEEQMLLESL
ncbi:hypothetical protein FC36_GL000716 [Ligilactobacillus equi DSM 15833 = JCM 10991]|uniref:ATPase domain-containing protein n=2 Tax=Ligilactobacillus equi TaxID=137357 RepID=A0A0R1TNY1_9LACO|nr:ATP-binding protein [Ligilactobacillus equi]KRL83153.1 hypothetical protein FC36_GL000716 [Ligilactobacillus equi DSM 15833 = JCM 10991]